jgi:hypothetical protein
MNLAKRSFRRRSMNIEMMKMVVWCSWLSMYLLLHRQMRMGPYHTYNDKPSTRLSFY